MHSVCRLLQRGGKGNRPLALLRPLSPGQRHGGGVDGPPRGPVQPWVRKALRAEVGVPEVAARLLLKDGGGGVRVARPTLANHPVPKLTDGMARR